MKFSFVAIFFFWSVGITAQPLPQPAAAVFVNVIQYRKLRLTPFHARLIEWAQTEVEAGLMASRCYGALILRIDDEELDKVRDMEGLSDEQIQQLRYGFFVEIREQPRHEPYSLNIKMVELPTKALVKQVSFNISVGVMEAAMERQDVTIKNISSAGFCEQELSPSNKPFPPPQGRAVADTDGRLRKAKPSSDKALMSALTLQANQQANALYQINQHIKSVADWCERFSKKEIFTGVDKPKPSTPEPSLSKTIAVRNFKWVGGAIPDTVKMLKCIENGVEQALYESRVWQVLSSTPKNLEYEYIAYGEASYDITTRSYNLVFKISCVSTNTLVCRIVLNIKNCNLYNIEDELQQKLMECTK